jgi:hypothetical protein
LLRINVGVLDGERGEREQVVFGVGEVVRDRGEPLAQLGLDPVELGVDLHRVGLVEDRRRAGSRRTAARWRGTNAAQVRRDVRPAPLPARPGQRGPQRVDQATVGVADGQLHPGQAAGDQAAQERQPARAGLRGVHIHPEDLPLPFGVDPRWHGSRPSR